MKEVALGDETSSLVDARIATTGAAQSCCRESPKPANLLGSDLD
jgi:hypothetical protein